MPGVTATEVLASGNVQITQDVLMYAGPMANWQRIEYPMSQSKLNPEEMRHIQATNPALYERIQKVGYKPEAHLGVANAFWASYGQIPVPENAVQFSEVKDIIQGLSGIIGGERGALVRALSKHEEYGDRPIVTPGGMVLASAKHMMQMSATNIAGEEVSKLVTGWEGAAVKNDPSYLKTVAGIVSSRGFTKEIQSVGVPGFMGPGVGSADIDVGDIRVGSEQLRKFAREVYGRNVSEKEVGEFRDFVTANEVIGKATRFPQSDVYNQNDLYLRLTLGGGENEIATNPLVAGWMRGDYDGEDYSWLTTSITVGDHGQLQLNNAGMGPVPTEEGALGRLIQMMEAASPDSVAQARQSVEGRVFGSEVERLSAILTGTDYFANEMRKHLGKQMEATSSQMSETEFSQFVLGNVATAISKGQFSSVAEKQEALYEAKGMMGRTYNALRRSIAERARELYGADSPLTKEVFSAAAGGYQPALDVATYSPNLPLGVQRGDGDPAISFGTARLMEAFGTMSFLYGGGYMPTITGEYGYGTQKVWETDEKGIPRRVEKLGYAPTWMKMEGRGIEAPLASMRNILGQTAMFGGEYTPSQMAAMLTTDPAQQKATMEAISKARSYVGQHGGSAGDVLHSTAGLEHLGAIWQASGMTSERAMWESQAPGVAGLRDMLLLRTREQMYKARVSGDEEYRDRVESGLKELRPSFEEATGITLEQAIGGALQRQSKIGVMAGDILATGRSPVEKAQALAKILHGDDVRDPQAPGGSLPIWASEMGVDDARLFAGLLQREHGVEGGWGSVGTSIHKGFEEGLRQALGKDVLTEDQLAIRGTLGSIFGMDSDVGFSGRPDILLKEGKEGWYLYDIKTYEGPYDPQQLQIYAAAIGELGYNISGASYLTAPRADKGADLRAHGREVATRFMEGGLTRTPVELAETQEGRMDVARGYLAAQLQRRQELEPLMSRISKEEAQRLEGKDYRASGGIGRELLQTARERAVTGAEPGAEHGEMTPLEKLSAAYGIDLSFLGVTAARVVGQEEYAAATEQWGTDKAGSGGFARGTEITIRQATEEEAQKHGIDADTLTRRRLAHEAGHVTAEVNPGLLEQAKAQLDKDLASGKLSQAKLQAQYGTGWRDQAARERVAMGIAQAFGALDTYGDVTGPLDVLLNRIGSNAVVGSGAGGLGGSGGDGGDDLPSFLDDPSRSGGSSSFGNMGRRQFSELMNIVREALFGQYKEPFQSMESSRLAFEVASGNEEALQGETLQRLAEGGKYEDIANLQKLQKFMGGSGDIASPQLIKSFNQLRQMSTSTAKLQSLGGFGEFESGMTRDQAQAAVSAIGERVTSSGPERSIENFTKGLDEATKRLKEHEEQIIEATKGYEGLNKEQQKAYRQVIGEVSGVLKAEQGLMAAGPAGRLAITPENQAGFASANRISAALQEREQASIDQAYEGLQGESTGQRIVRSAQGLYGDLTTGFKMMQMSRLWGYTGGKAIQAQNVASQEEMAVQGALGSWSGGASIGGVAGGLLGIQAQQQVAQATMGRGSYMAYGGIQQAMSGLGGELAGVGLPALGVGMISQSLLGKIAGPQIGGALGIVAGAFGVGSYLNSVGSDPAERDYRLGGGLLSAGAGLYGDLMNRALTLQGMPEVGSRVYDTGRERGLQMRAGEIGAFEGDRSAQAVTMRHWAEQTALDTKIGDSAIWSQTAGAWQQITDKNISNLNEIPTEMIASAMARGYNVQDVTNLTRQLGGVGSQTPQMMEALVAAPNRGMAALGQYAAAGQVGLVGMDYFTQNLGNMQEMTGWQSNRFQGLMSGDAKLWSRYAAGENLGLTGTAMDILGQIGPQDWMMAAEPDTGYALHTTTGARYGGQLDSEAARSGGMRGIQWAFLEQQNEMQKRNEAMQANAFQRQYAYQTGATMPGVSGQVAPGLMGMIQQTGGMWGLQDQQRQMGYDWQQYQFGYQQQMTEMSNRHWNENWSAQWDRFQTTRGWEDKQEQRNQDKYAVQDEHWLSQWGRRENMAQLSFGWGMEDLDEGIRFSTGRDKLRLMRQKERATITESIRSEGSQEDKEYWEEMKQFRDEDLETAKQHREQINEWKEEDLERSKKQHDERSDAELAYFERTRQHYQEQFALEGRRIQLEREFWREQQKATAEDMKMTRQVNELQRALRVDQLRLSYDAQDSVARLNVGLAEMGRGVDAVISRIKAFNDAVSGSSGPVAQGEYHDGGPVGANTMGSIRGEVNARLEEGEYVVPRNGSLVMRDERVVDLLSRIAGLLEAGNGRFTIMVQNPQQGVGDVKGYLDAAYRN